MKSLPKISVVTVCYNCHEVVEHTICNVLKQTYPNMEYIVIDGGSTDGTQEIVKRYADRLAYWVSEPDHGIYDAMNKGIEAATGDWIIFRNAGDYFFEPTTIADVFDWYEDHGEALIVGGMRKFRKEGYMDKFYDNQDADLWHRAYIPHPSTFVRMSVQKANLFPTSYRIASDYYFFQKLMLEGVTMALYDGIVALFDCDDGISSNRLSQCWEEMLSIRQSLGAPKSAIDEARKRVFSAKLAGWLTNTIKKSKYLYSIYHQRHQLTGWTLQALSVTLKDR